MNTKWHRRYLELAKLVSTWSKDPRKQVGAVVVDAGRVRGVGFNGFPKGIADLDSRLKDRAIKNLIMVHAEVNALIASDGQGDTIYVYPCLPCSQCLGNIIQYGRIRTIVTLPVDLESSWNQELVLEIAKEAGITVICVEGFE